MWRNLFLIFILGSFSEAAKFKRGPRIDIFSQHGSDIAQFRDLLKMGNRAANALPPTSRYKWRTLDSYGYYQIPYSIKGPFTRGEVKMILTAMVKIQNNTCIRFVKRTTERDYIDIQNEEGEGCYSYVGNHGGRSQVNLESSGRASCMYPDIVIHELLHSVGLWHEHMRYDRDNYLKIHYENIARGMTPQFIKIPPSQGYVYGTPYDYRSVMHYEKAAFAKQRGLITMETTDPQYQDVIGTVSDASINDYKKVCAIYGCSRCPGASTETKN
ncbi:hypothetical protein FO519_003345 [Halicephalobus sp. NKZ332]|nr:hypothetical protein FO519_003345 [Halicephalobus sp. NKZ332]